MRLLLMLAGALLATTATAAAELPLAGAYGTENGCALHNKQAAPGGENTVFAPERLRFRGAVCQYTEVTESEADDGAPQLEVKVSCASGHDETVPGTLRLAEADGMLSVELLSGQGPEGEYPACAAPS